MNPLNDIPSPSTVLHELGKGSEDLVTITDTNGFVVTGPALLPP